MTVEGSDHEEAGVAGRGTTAELGAGPVASRPAGPTTTGTTGAARTGEVATLAQATGRTRGSVATTGRRRPGARSRPRTTVLRWTSRSPAGSWTAQCSSS